MSFLNFTGESRKENNNYVFVMQGFNEDISRKNCINIPSPIIDNNFKQVFGNNPEITKSLLNSILYPNDNNIIKVEFLPEELPAEITKFPEEVKFNFLDSLRVNILCKCSFRCSHCILNG